MTASAPSVPRRAAAKAFPRRVCFVSEYNNYIARGGAAAYLGETARSMREAGAETVLLVMRSFESRTHFRRAAPDMSAARADFDRVELGDCLQLGGHLLRRSPRLWRWRLLRPILGSPWPQPIDGWLPAPVEEDLAWARRRVGALAPDMVVANYFNAAPVFDAAPSTALRAILIHDVVGAKVLGAGETALDRPARERAAFAQADLCLAIKRADAASVTAATPETTVAVLPPTCEAEPVDPAAPRGPVVVFVGASFHANREGLDWFLRDVWPRVRAARPDAVFVVAGAICAGWEGAWPDGVDPRGFVDDLTALYGEAAVAVTPIRLGSGVKIKTVEALAHGVPVVATTPGADGVDAPPADALRIADDPEAFAAAVIAMLDGAADPAPRLRARAYAEAGFGRAATVRRLTDAIAAARDRRRARPEVVR